MRFSVAWLSRHSSLSGKSIHMGNRSDIRGAHAGTKFVDIGGHRAAGGGGGGHRPPVPPPPSPPPQFLHL